MKLKRKINDNLLRLLEYLEKKKKVRLIGLAILLILSLIFRSHLKEFSIVLILFVLAAISVVYKKFGHIPIGFELISFNFIILIFAYNPIVAIVVTILVCVTSRILTAGLDPTFFIQIGLYTLLGFFSYFILGLGLVMTGMIIVVLYNIIKRMIYTFAFGYDPVTNLIAGFLNISINYFLLSRLGPSVLGLLS